jgi:hypothetical protein
MSSVFGYIVKMALEFDPNRHLQALWCTVSYQSCGPGALGSSGDPLIGTFKDIESRFAVADAVEG